MLWGGRWAMASTARSGQHGADRQVRAGGPALPPRGHRLGHAAGLALQGPDVLQPQPGVVRVAGPDRAGAQLLALGEGPVEAPQVVELRHQPVVELEQVGDVGAA